MSLEYFLKRLFALFLFLSVFIVQYSFAQGTGTLRGTIIDGTTKEGLPGANVVVVGTSNGAASDLDGNFVIYGVPSGNQLIVVSYIGYLPDTLEVNISPGKTITKEISLSGTVVQGKEVLVTGQAVGQLQAINQQLASDKISSVVSEARIQELPDFNAAAAISRLPGVSALSSSGEANKIVIRGLAPQYNQITIGGIALASTGSTQIGANSLGTTSGTVNNDRSVDLSMVSPYMLKTISVYKSLTPDMNANSIGGTVNMELREAPSELHTDLLWQSGYTAKSNTYGNYRAVASVSTRFFDDLLGVYVLGNIEAYDRDADNMQGSYSIAQTIVGSNGYMPVLVQNVQLNRHIETRNRYGGNLILDYKLPEGSIKLVNMFSRLNSDSKDFRTIYNYATGDLTFRYRQGENDVDVALNSLSFTNDFGFMSVDIKAANNYSRNNLPYSPQFDFIQTKGVGLASPNVIPEDLVNQLTYKGVQGTTLSSISLFSTDYKENGQAYKIDLKFPYSVGVDLAGYVKAGIEYNYKQHKNQQGTPYMNLKGGNSFTNSIIESVMERFPGLMYDSAAAAFLASNFTSNDEDLYDTFLDDKFGTMLWVPDAGILTSLIDYVSSNPEFSADNSTVATPGGWYNGYFQTLTNTYKYIEKYSAAYLMSEVNWNKLMIVGGIRFEKEKSLYEAFNISDGREPKFQTYTPVTVYPENEFWLPMVQARYNVTDWLDVRYAYTQTLARPDYHQLSPHFTINQPRNSIWAGNPDLRPAHSYNHDVVFTFHNNEIGLFSVGGFYKQIKDFTYSTQYPLYETAPAGFATIETYTLRGVAPNIGAMLYTYMNTPHIATVKGIEVDLQTRLWYMPVPFNGIVLGINYTHIKSEATYPWREARTTYVGRTAITAVFDSTRSGRLINQPNDILNAYAGYDYLGFSARVSFLFQGNSVSYVGNYSEQDGFTRDYFRIDASVRQILPWYGIEVYLDLNNINSATNKAAQQSIGGFTSENYYGLTTNLGVRYRL
jgi:TonB-dependent receptor